MMNRRLPLLGRPFSITFAAMPEYILVMAALCAGAFAAYRLGKLTRAGAVAAGLTGIIVFFGSGYFGLAVLFAFFGMGVLATAHGKARKAVHGEAQQRRNAGQVFANGGMAALLSLLMTAGEGPVLPYPIMLAAALASAAADTVSSELGTLYGRRFINILTFRREANGLDGVVSLEGTFVGIAASAVIASIYFAFGGGRTGWLIITAAGTIGNLADSILGATLERKGIIRNDAVNFMNTAIAALAAWGLWAAV